MQNTDIEGLRYLWQETSGDPRVLIAVLDGPVALSHPVLSGAKLSYLDEPSSVGDDSAVRHGTHVASLIFGQPSGPVKGIAPHCTGLIIPIFENSSAVSSQTTLAHAITRAVEAGAQIINVSAGQFSESGDAHPILADTVRMCETAGVLIVAAAGNEGCPCAHVPSAASNVLAVGATDCRGRPAEFSNWSELYRTHGIVAPGVDVLGAGPGGTLERQSGTSQATAIVSGVVGLLLSLQLTRGHSADPRIIRSILLRSSVGCTIPERDCPRFLAGRLNIPAAVQMLIGKVRAAMNTNAEPTLDPTTPATTEPTSVAPSSAVTQSACGCGCSGGAAKQLVYALGTLSYDFGTEARRDSFTQRMKPNANPYDPVQLSSYLKENLFDASSLIWTLNQETTPIYAVQPQGAFAREGFETLLEFFGQQLTEGVERVSIPGVVTGKVRLFNGQVVPSLVPELRGMYSWTTQALTHALTGPAKKDTSEKVAGIRDFLDRVYFELRNLGLMPQDRALNFAATNAFGVVRVFESALRDEMQLDSIYVERSPVCRPESDCWDVKLLFFDPKKQLERAWQAYRVTVDVSDHVPVLVGGMRKWAVPGHFR
jgi:subtilisin family serine protease